MEIKKQLSRKQLLKEPDEFLSFTAKLFKYILDNKTKIALAFGMLAIIVMAFSGIKYYALQAENKAFFLLEKAASQYEKIKNNKKNTNISVVEDKFKFIIGKYSGNNAGKMAGVMLANIYFQKGKYSEAIELYKKNLSHFKNNGYCRNIIISGIGYCYEGTKDLKKAVKYFEMIAAGDNPFMKDEAYFNLGRLYFAIGDNNKSKKSYEQIVSQYAGSIYYEIAKEKALG